MVEFLALVEHRLRERALVATRNGDRAHQVQAPGSDLIGQIDHVARAGDIGPLGLVGRGGEGVDGRQVVDVRTAELLAVVDRKAEPRLDEVATQSVEALAAWIEALSLSGESSPRAATNQHEHGVASRQEQGDEVSADESGCACDEVGHAADNSFLRQSETEQCLSQSSSPLADPPSDAR